jgi:signal transduction histidine kinase
MIDVSFPKRSRLLLALLVALWAVLTGPVWAQPPELIVGPGFAVSNLRGHLWQPGDSLRTESAHEFLEWFRQGHGGQVLIDEVPNLGDDDHPHWVGFRLRNMVQKPLTLILELDFVGPDDIGFYVWQGNRIVKHVVHASWRTPPIERDVPHRVPAFRFNVQPGQTYTCALRIQQRAGYLVLPIQLHEEHYFYTYATFVNVTHGLAVGFLFLAAIIGVAFWLLTQQRLYVYYVLYVIGIAGFATEEQGYLNYYLLPYSDLLASQRAWPLFSQIAVIGHTLFAIQFLHLNQLRYRRWVIAGTVVCAFSVGLILALLFGVPFTDAFYRTSLAVSFSYISLSFVYLLLAARQQRRESYLYVLAVSPLFLSILYGVLATVGLVPESWLLFAMLSYSPAWEVGVLCIGLAISFSWEQRQKVRALEEASRIRMSMVQALDDAQESERQRIAQDLHDDVGNTLAAAKGSLSTISKKLIIQTEFPEVARAQSLIERAGQDLRTISHNLMPVEFERYALTDAVRQAVERANMSVAGTQFDFIQAGTERQLAPERSLVVYRIINELINNILKHSGARTAIVQMIFQPESLIVTLEDDGSGFKAINLARGSSGIGLKNVSSRANYIGATLDISSDASGTCVIVEVPYA